MAKLNPGDIAPETGMYKVIDQKGRTVNKVSVAKGDHMPPTQEKGYCYELDY